MESVAFPALKQAEAVLPRATRVTQLPPMMSRSCFRFGWPIWAIAASVALSSFACDSKKKEASLKLEEDKRELLDPVERPRDYSHRCKAAPGAQPVTLRASPNKQSAVAVEVGGAAALEQGFVVGVLRTATETTAELLYLDGRGGSVVTKLGRVHGSVEPPQVTVWGDAVIATVVDNDAGHTRLRMVKVESVARNAQVTWGPEVQVRRGETQSFSLAVSRETGKKSPPGVLLAWDDFDQSSLRSTVRGLLLDPQSMQPVRNQFQVSPTSDDATSPLLVSSRAAGPSYYSVWLAYEQQGARQDTGNTLVDEPPKALRAQRLDSEGKSEGQPLTISRSGSNVLVYDARVLETGELVIVYREAESGRDEGASPVRISIVGPDGSIAAHTASHEDLGLGAPAVIETGKSGILWLTARARESDVLLGSLTSAGQVEHFEMELGLKEKMPLAGRAGRLLVMEPDGLDLRLSAVLCSP